VQLAKALAPREVKDEGRSIDVSSEHPENALAPIEESLEGLEKDTDVSERHLPKAPDPIVVTEAGMVIEAIIWQLLNAEFPMDARLAGNETDSRAKQLENAELPMDAQAFGIAMALSALQD